MPVLAIAAIVRRVFAFAFPFPHKIQPSLSVNNYTKAAQFERGVYSSPRHSLLCALHRTCEKAFTALSQEADGVEQSVKAMRILAMDMR